MCQETLDIIKTVGTNNIEMQLALQCAPLISGLKISNLLIISETDDRLFREIIEKTDIAVYKLLNYQGKTVYLLYREAKVIEFLQSEKAKEVFIREGYDSLLLSDILHSFQKRYEHYRIKGGVFPHEMGLLLGYPVEDVVGFMENNGNNFLCMGYWKVYDKPFEKQILFKQFEYAKERIVKLISCGISIWEIAGNYSVA